MMEAVRLVFPIPPAVLPGAYLRIFTDNATGTVDTATAISERIKVYPQGRAPSRNLEPRNGGARNNGIGGGAGRNDGVRNEHPRNDYQPTVVWSGGNYYGPIDQRVFLFAARIYDEAGRAVATAPPELTVVVNSAPRPPKNLVAASISGGRLTVTFTQSEEIGGINNTPV